MSQSDETGSLGRDGKAGAKAPPRERILDAAYELFVRYGIRGVGVEAIAEAAGTNKMTLYRHFPSKDDLIVAWLERLFAEWNDVWSRIEAVPDGDPSAQIEAFVGGVADAFEAYAERGCPFMNALADLPEKEHPARRALEEYKAFNRKRMARFFRRLGVSEPSQTAEEIQLLMDGAKAGIPDLGVPRSRARFARLARALLEDRLAAASSKT